MYQQYDIVIVGGGNAGCVLASRLSEVTELSVLLLEAGGDHGDNPLLHVPAGGMKLWADASMNWNLETIPQPGYGDRRINHPRGKGLGGTTLVNLNNITFPDRGSIDNWEALGNPGWSFNQMQHYYRKFHTFHEPDQETIDQLGLDYLESSLHGKSGPIDVTYGSYQHELNKAWSETFKALGRKSTSDHLSGDLTGGHRTPGAVNPRSASRSYAASSYLNEEVQERPNLHIVTHATAEKVIFRESKPGISRQIDGVQYRDGDGELRTVSAKREIIICAGVFKSPQILELSGIGSAFILKDHGIEPVVDLPGVGENLQDHAVVAVSFESAVATLDSLRDPVLMHSALREYQEQHRGPLTSSTFNSSFMPCVGTADPKEDGRVRERLRECLDRQPISKGLWKQFDIIRRTVEDPNLSSIQYFFAPVQLSPYQSTAEVSEEARQSDYCSIYASLSHPFSRGSVHINSKDPQGSPTIDPRYFSHPADVEIAARHLQYVDTITSTQPLKSLLKVGGRTIPPNLDLRSIEKARELVRSGFTTYHPCGSCSMMPEEDGGVVDFRLRVHGVKGLRIVDASIFPLIPRGNIQSSVYAVAERAADMIKQDLSISA